jgi:hypothetical protein
LVNQFHRARRRRVVARRILDRDASQVRAKARRKGADLCGVADQDRNDEILPRTRKRAEQRILFLGGDNSSRWGAARLSETSGCGKLNRNRR